MRRFGRLHKGKVRRGDAASVRRAGYRTRRTLVEVLEERAMLANQPDLAITAAAAPGTAVEGNAAKISITWTVENQGAAATSGPWKDAVYLSSSGTVDGGSVRIDTLDESFQGPLAAGASYTVTRVVTLPEAAPGAQFLVVRTDDGQSLDDANPANNLSSLPITLSAPAVDLAVTGATAPVSAVAGNGNTIALSWTVQNQGTTAAAGDPTDAVYLSDTPSFDPHAATLLDSRSAGDQLPLAAGASYTVHRAVALPDIAAGNHYLFFVANSYGGQGETDQGAETNNAYSLPITIASPGNVDLAVTGGTAPGAAVAGNGQAINISYTVENLGAMAAASHWTDGIYLSSQPTFDSSAISLGYYPGGARHALAGGGSYTVTQSLTLPSYAAGAAYLLVRTDRDDDQSETNKTNNFFAIPITLSAPDVDFTVSAATAPATAVVGDNNSITVDYTVANQGTDAAAGSWSDAIYVSDQPTFDSSAQRLETVYSGGGQLPASLAAGASYTVHESVALPDTALGARYLLIRTNVGAGASSSQAETDAANNTYAISIALSAPAVDLAISNATAPATVEAGNGQSITVSWKVTNQGSAPAASSWYDDVSIGDDANYDPGNTSLLGYYGNYQNQLAAGASYVATKTILAPNVSPGVRQLVFVTDTGDGQAETQKSNNLIALPITFTQADVDLTMTAATSPATATAGAAISVGWTVTNQGSETAAGGWTDGVYLSDVPTLDANAVFLQDFAGPASLAAGGTYSPSQTITLPGSASGNKYLLFVTNRSQTQGETNYANDVYAVPISLSTPDLQATTLSGPSTAILGQKVQLSWSVTNQGSVAAPGGWSDTIYLSDTPGGNPFGLGDTYVGSVTHHSPLAAGASYTEQQTFTLPASRLGARYLVVVANANGAVGDADPTNNRFAMPMTLSAPDLAATTAAAPASAVVNDAIQVSWTVKNQGSVAAPATWSDGVYLSSSPVYDSSAVYIGSFDESAHSGLAAGASYTETRSLTLPAFAAGQQYLLFVTNQYNGQPESDTPEGGYYGIHGANNVFAAPITLSAPDLAVTAASAPVAAVVGNGDSISLSYTVTNQGIAPADGSWSDFLYVSDRPTYDDSATYLASLQYHSGPLAPGASYSSSTNVTLPNTASGARYLLVVVNLNRSQGESDLTDAVGANNVYALPITLTAPGVDLTVTGATAPASVIAGDSLPVSFTVENQGSDAAGANWTDQVYFSTSPTLDSSAINLGGFSPAQSPLAAGGSYVQSQNVTLSGAPVGAGYLLFVANGSNDQSETDPSNNVFAVPIVVSAPDLAVTAASAPSSSTVGNNLQLAVNYTVQNVGAVPAHGNWYDALYVSDLPTLDGSATFVTRLEQSPPALAAGASYGGSFNVSLPPTAAGARYLLFVTNAGLTSYSGQPESDGANAPGADNVFAVPIALTAPDVDLAVSNASAPANIVAGDNVSISFDVTNQGSDAAATSWTDGVYFSTSPTFDKDQATLLGSFSAGQSPLAGGASYGVNRTVSIPSLPLGAGYLFFATNINGNQSETDAGADNVVALPITIGAPDLAVTTVSAPAAANTGDSINVSWTVANQGASPAPASWTDAIYLSTKPTYDYTARYLGSFGESAHAGLAEGGAYNDSRTVSLPSYAPTGSLYLLVVTNAFGDQPESDAGVYGSLGANNYYALPITVGAPDLAVTTASAPASAVVGNNESISVSYTVKNVGAVDSSGYWSDSLYLSDKPTYDSSATYVQSLHYNYSSLAAGSSYTQNANVTLPVEATGNLYLLFIANLGSISESDSTSGGVGANNVYAVPISLSLPDVDLVASNPSAPAAASLGQSIAVSFDVTNAGGESAALGWGDAVYYSSRPALDSSAVNLGSFYPSQLPLGAGAGYSDSGNVTLPASLPLGAGYLLFVTNAYGGQGESDATNNVVSLPITLTAADLAATDVTAPPSATFDSSISVSWTVANQSVVSADANWFDAVYISSQPDWRSGTRIATFSETSHAGLAAGADYSDTQSVTIPSYLRAGDVYLIVVTDVYDALGDANRLNNAFVTPIRLSPSEADLTITSATAPATGVQGSSIAVSWTVTNQGAKDASSSWYDSIFLSTKPTFDNTAVYLQVFNAPPAGSSPLAPGASYTLNANIPLTGTATGGMYLLFVTNSDHNQSESDSTNDVYALPITLGAPDLTVSSASAPAAAALGQTISVSWTATNQGGVAAPAAWYDAVYVSSKNTFDNTATLLASFYEGTHAGLDAAGSYSDTWNVTLPATGLGQRYLLFVADAFNAQPETSETNNFYAVPITLAAPDLTVAGASAPAAAELGSPFQVSWTVQNASSVAAPAPWHDAVYVSSVPTLDGTATLVAQFDESARAGLAGGASYTETQSITLPSTAIGQRYLLFVTDSDHGQPQTSAANDVYAVPITLSGADLAVMSVAAPSIVPLGSTVELSWTVTNQGNAAAQANWSDSVYLSDTNVLDGSARFVGSFAAGASPLAAGASYVQSQSVLIPNAALGSRYLLIVADASQQQAESNKANNVRVVPIQLAQVDLSAGSASAPTSANFGGAIDVSWTATNAGSTEINQPWSDRIYLSTSSTLDVNTARLLATVDASAWAPLAPGASYSQTARVALPLDATTTAGSYYLFVVVDGLNQAAETDETNNATSQPISLGLPPLPDLAPTKLVVPASGLTGQGFNVSWTDQNNGTATADGPWQDYVWISTSSTLDNSALFLGQFTYNSALDAGQSVTRAQHFNLPGIAGQYYVIIRANADGAVKEGPGSADDTTASTTTIDVQTTPLPDLAVSVIVPPSDGVLSGTTVPVTYTVTNNGNAPTQAPLWYDAVFISQSPDLTLTGNDFADGFNIQVQPLGVPIFAENASYLAPGESYSQTVNVPLPVSAAGPWYVYVLANRTFVHTPLDNFIDTGAVRESNSINDLAHSAAFNVALAPAPDLAVTRVQAPSQAFSGQTMNLSWTVTNQGPGIAIGQPLHVGFAPTQAYAPATPAQSAWQESVYLSSSQSLDASAVLLGTFTHNGALGPGDSFTQSQTVTLPVGISGQYYLIVQDDSSQQVFEAGATANNVLSAAAATNVNLTPPPDLQIASIVAPAAALASHTLAISYQVTNAGSTATPQNSWTDTVYLASGTTLDASTDLKLGDLTHRGILSAGGSYTQTAAFTLPNDLNGTFYVFVVTDSGNLVFELDKSNNVVSAGNATVVSSKPADLIVTSASAPAAANPGQVIPVSWTVTNQGAGDTAVGDWTDKVYATTDTALGANRVLIAAFTRHHGLLQPGASYSETELVEIPYTLTGAYNLFVETDAPVTEAEDGQGAQTTGPGGAVYEAGAEANNVSAALAVLISTQLANLTVGQVQLLSPATLATGGLANVRWTVQNSGAAGASSTHWYDDVYLSPTPTFDPNTAVYLGSAFHNNPLPAGGQYTATATFTVPPDMAAGTNYLIVRADRPSRPPNTEPQYVNLVVESSDSDNDGASAAITVDLGPTPDLTAAVTAPLSALSGQTIHVDWTVTNNGAATLAANARWYDTVYLSLDRTFDANADIPLGSVVRLTGLAAGANYAAGGDFRLPAGLAGIYYVIVVADAGAAVYERGVSADRIGLSDQALDVSLQPPLDLVAGTVTIPASAVPGQPITVTYSVSNNSSNSYAGDWFDSLYLSPTNTWQPSNPLLGRVHHAGGVAANGSYSETLTAPLPGVSPGTYYVVLRSDIRNQVPETDETNNLSASAQTSLDVPEIIAGTPGSPVVGSLTQGGSAYYKVTIDAGQTLQFALSDAQTNDVNGLYVSFGQAPSPSQSDFHGDQALGANQTITIPSTRAGTYYVQVISRTVYGYNSQSNPTAVADYSLAASIIPFSVTAVGPAQVGNAGSSTLKISGAKFDRDTTFQLLDGSGHVIQASSVYWQDGSTAFATYDLDGRAIGPYDVQATAGDGGVAKLAGGLTLVAGSGGKLATSAIGPGIVLVNRLQAFTLTYANTGDADMPAPLFAVSSPTGVTMGLSPDYVGSPVVQFLAVSGSGPAGVLRPGDSASVSVYFRSGTPNDPYGFVWNVITADDTTPLDWNVVLENYLSSADTASLNWNAIWARVQARVGDTWGDLVRALARDASLLPSELGSNASPSDLLRLEIALAAADVEPSIRGTVVAADPTVTLGGRRISAEDTATGDTYYGVVLNDGSFAISGLPDGTYQLKVADVANDSLVQATIAGGASADHLSVPVSRGFALTGAVFAADGFTPSGSASISLIASDGTVRSAFSAPDGSFGVFGLSAGAYTLVVESAGFARQVSTITLTNADLAENFTLAPEATISGDISLAPGGADHGTLAVSAVATGAFSAALHFNAEASTPGTFTIHDLPAGTYELTLWMDGYFPQTIDHVVVGAGQHVSLGPITFAPTASISGSLASNDASLDLNQQVVGLYSGGTQVAATTTDAFGNYTFANLSAGTYEVRPAGFAFANPATRSVTIAAGENATTPSIDVEAGATIAGAVTNSLSGGTLSGVIVYLDAADGTRKTATTDVNGNYSFSGLPIGAYQVYVSRSAAGGLQTVQVSSVEGQAIIANLNVAAAAVINGTVSDSAGGAISGATVKLYQTGSATLAASTQTAGDGSYQFLILAPGAFDIVVTDPTASFAPQTNVSATAGTVTEDFLAGSATLSVTVSDSINPIAGAYVMLSFDGPAGSELLGTTTLDDTGIVTFHNLAAGNYTVAVLGTTGDAGATTLSLPANGTDSISLEIGPLSAVSGIITDATSTPIPNALVELVPSSSAGDAFIIAGESDGSFSFSGVPDGTYTLIASAPGYLSSYIANVTVSGTNVVQNAALTPTADTVTGRILDVAGAPVAQTPVALVDAAGNVLATATTQEDGTFTLTDAGTTGMHVEVFYGQNVYDQPYTFAHAAGAVTTPDFALPATIALAAGDAATNSAAAGTGNAALLANSAGFFASAQLNDFGSPQGPTDQAWLASLQDLQKNLAELFGGLLTKDQVPKPQPFTDNCNNVHQSQAWPLYQNVLNLIDRRDDAAQNANDIAGQVVTDALLTLGTFLVEGAKLAGTVAGLGLAVVGLGPEGLAAGAFGFSEVQVSIGLLIGGVIKGLASAEAESEGEGFVDDLTKLPELATRIEQSVKILEIAAEKILGQEVTLEEEIAIEENLIKFATGGKVLGGIPYQAYLDIADNKALLNTLKGLGQVVGLVTNSLEAAKAIVSDPFENTTEFAEITEQEYDRYKEALEQFDSASEKVEKAYEKYIEFLAKEREDANDAMSNSEWKHDPKPLVPPFDIPLPPPFDHWPIHIPQIPHFPFDPNDIIGPEGYGDQHFVSADQPLSYEIEFENESAATAPAQEVTITEQLDPNIDPRSFRLGDFGWGGMRFSPPSDSAFFQTTIDETDTLGILVQVTATIDVSTGTAIWNFLSIDPATGEKPLDGAKGFLPPDDGSGSGQGFATYTVLPNASVQTGDVIHAQATIYFDSNAPIDTRTIFNTIDDGLSLGSQISGLPAHEGTPQFTITWAPTAQDPSGSAVATYDVYVSDNGGPFRPFIINTTATQATFNGQKGHTYTFYSLATDNAGNQQSPASAVQATTTVGDAVQNATGLTISPTEGQSFSGAVATFTGTDPNGSGDDFTAMIDWGDGSSLTAGTISGSAAQGYTISGSHTYLEEHAALALKAIIADQGNQQITVSGRTDVADAPLTAAGVTFAPTEGATFSGTVATFTDANPNGAAGDYTATIDWGDGSSLSPGTIGVNPAGGFLVTGSHAYADEGVHTVIIAISDAGGSNDTALSTAHVADAPIDAAAVTLHATEGATFSGTVATFSDANPNGDAGDYTAEIDWGDGSSVSIGTISANPGGGFLVTGSHLYPEYGTYEVTVTVSDVGGSAATAHSTAQIADAPLSAAGLTISSTEGATFSGAVATFTDANPAGVLSDYSATIYWGDGASSTGTIAAGANGLTISGSHVYAAENARLPLSVVISDAGGARATASGTANVADAPLSITAAAVSIPAGGAADHVLLATFTDTGGAQPVGHYAAVIDWGDGSPSEAGTIGFSNGVLQIFGSHVYASAGTFAIGVTVQDEGGATDGLTEQASIELTAHQKYVIAVYHDVLNRSPDPSGLAYWTQLLDGGAAISSVAAAIAHSNEYYANFVIKPAYVKLLGRQADESGVAYWTAQMHAGLTDQQLEAMLVSSDEFYANAGGTDAAWVNAVYQLLLGRQADLSGEAYWSGQLAAGHARQQIALQIADSAENNTQLINEDYFHYLGRDADPDGLAYWLAQFAAGKTNEDIISGFTGSEEYYKQHTS